MVGTLIERKAMTHSQKIETMIQNGSDQLYTVCYPNPDKETIILRAEIGRASCRERV